ncbi:MAG: hypothetical protein AAF525_05490 [Pseudomonadota bacterium]
MVKRISLKRAIQLGLVVFALCLTPTASSANAWYFGVVSRIALLGADGSFVVRFESSALDNCDGDYAYFNVSTLGTERVEKAYSLAMVSLTTGLEMGVVIDKSINGTGGQCDAVGMTADIRR